MQNFIAIFTHSAHNTGLATTLPTAKTKKKCTVVLSNKNMITKRGEFAFL